jgi:hypothetical protein
MRAMDFMLKAFPSVANRRRPKLLGVARGLPPWPAAGKRMCWLLTQCSQE